MFNRLEKHIVINDVEDQRNIDLEEQIREPQAFEKSKFEEAVYSISTYNINTATVEELDSIKGIGIKLASRIVKFRSNLGGILKIEQLKDVYGLSQENYDYMNEQLYVENPKIKQLEINKMQFKTLLKHPYFDYDITKSIFNLRDKLGRFENMDDLKILTSIDDVFAKKIEPYISFK